MKNSAFELLKTANLFYKSSKSHLDAGLWALAALEDEGKDLDVTRVTAMPAIASTPFGEQVKSLIKTSPPPEDWNNWFAANKSLVESLAERSWSYFDQNTSISEIEYNPKTYVTVDAFMTLNKLAPEWEKRFNPRQEYLIKGVGRIPNLFIQIGTLERETFVTPRELAHDNWLLESIPSLMGMGKSGDSLIKLQEFAASAKDKIRHIRTMFNTSAPKHLGGGADGVAFDIGDGKILKVFRDEHSFNKAREAQYRLHKNPVLAGTEAMIYDVGVLGVFPPRYEGAQGTPIYYYIMEKMTPLGGTGVDIKTEVRALLHETVKNIDRNHGVLYALKQDIDDADKAPEIKKEVARLAANWADQYNVSQKYNIEEIENQVPELKRNWVQKYVEEIIMKYLTGRTDLHMGNLGVTSYGYLRYFDPAYSGWESAING